MKETLPIQFVKSNEIDETKAINDISQQISITNVEGILFFCSSHYNLDKLSNAINKPFNCPVIGCTTSGEILGKYNTKSIIAIVFNTKYFAMHTALIDDVSSFNLSEAMKLTQNIEHDLRLSNNFASDSMFAFLLTDGLSLKEDKIISFMNQALGDINIIGGSAGDDLKWKNTHIFYSHKFFSNASTLIFFETLFDVDVFKLQHFEPTEKELITTDVDFENHIVKELNGEPAASAYAKINNLDKNTMDSHDFSMYPFMLNIGNEWYIRSIAETRPDDSLRLYCAIDFGLPLRIGEGRNLIERLEQEILAIEEKYDDIYFSLGCDCILRKLEIIDKGYTKLIEQLLNRIKFIGFSGYGEQYNGIHFNQTLVAIVVGKKKND